MTVQVQEITNFKSGIDLSLDPILSPSDAFINIRNGFVHKGTIRSRKGLRGFATGVDEDTRLVSRLSDEITSEVKAAVGDGGTDYSITTTNTQIERTVVSITAPTEVLTVTFTYTPDTRVMTPTGNTGAGTNSINWQTGAINVSFSGAIGVGNDIEVTYNYHPDLAVMGITEYVRTPTPRDLIVCDQDFPYIFDGANNDFDRIAFTAPTTAFTGGTDAFFTFQNWRLHSRGAVPAAAGALVLSDVLFMTNNVDPPFFYDGTTVDLVSAMPEFQQPAEGVLSRALHVIAYGERLIWLRPRLGGQIFGQAVLWGPINDNSGLTLDYQGSGSGILSAVTDSIITGWHWLRDTLIVFFETDVYALELTDDAFRPFRWTKLEDERGVEPTHATTGFLGNVESPGRLGILGTNARRTDRVDSKIPFFTRQEIDPLLISHMYGEEMEEDSQFWWTFPKQSTPDLTTSNKVLVKNFEEQNYSIYDLPISVLNKTVLGDNTVWDNLAESFAGSEDNVVDDADPPVAITVFPNPKADVTWDRWGLQEERYKTLVGDHHGFIHTVNKSFNDGYVLISPKLSSALTSAITLGALTIIETEYHHFQVDDVVSIINVEGTTELNGKEATITRIPDRNSVEVDIDSTDFTAYTQGGQLTKLIDFEVEFVPFNPGRPLGLRTYIGKMDFLVKTSTGEYAIDFFENRSHDTWTHATQPKTTYTFSSGGSDNIDDWFSIYVDNSAEFHRWRIRQRDADEQISIKSIRIWFTTMGESNT